MTNSDDRYRFELPSDEEERLTALAALDLASGDNSALFASVAELAASICNAPIALVGMVDREAQWFLAAVGRGTEPTPRAESFCTHAVMRRGLLEVPDARLDPRFRDNPHVLAEGGIRFYAGMPVGGDPAGSALGTLCVVDRAPRQLGPDQRAALEHLGTVVDGVLGMRRRWRDEHLALIASEQRLRTITDNIPAAVCYIDSDFTYRFNNRSYAQWLARPLQEITGQSIEVVHGEHSQAEILPHLRRALSGERVTFEISLPRRGERRYLRGTYVPDIDGHGRVRGVYGLTSDATEVRRAEEQLHYMAAHDALTGLDNRHALMLTLAAATARALRSGRLMALLYLDVDRFKQINDSLGHEAGDQVLIEFARRLRQSVRGSDTVARLAGDEFVIVLEGLQEASQAEQVAQKVLAAMATPIALAGGGIEVSTSIGIALQSPGQGDADDLLRRADRGLYAAKSAGRGTFRLATG